MNCYDCLVYIVCRRAVAYCRTTITTFVTANRTRNSYLTYPKNVPFSSKMSKLSFSPFRILWPFLRAQKTYRLAVKDRCFLRANGKKFECIVSAGYRLSAPHPHGKRERPRNGTERTNVCYNGFYSSIISGLFTFS